MPSVHPDLQTLRTPLVPRQRRFSANWSRALILGTLLLATLNSSRAQDTGAPTGKPNPPYPGESEITFQWNMSCPSDKTLHIYLSGSGRRRRIGPRNSLGYLFGNVTSQRRSATSGRHFL